MDGRRRQGAVLTDIRTVAQTGSTNADLLTAARAGAAEGIWLRAERQSAGRGRLGRAWQSPAGNLYASTLVRLRSGDPAPAALGFVAAVSLDEVVAALLGEQAVALKWPNDLLVSGAKLSGILLERADDAVVVGIGVNVAAAPEVPGRATTSLAAHDAGIGAAALLEMLAEAFERWLARWRGEGFGPVRARWLARAHPPGTALRVALPGGETVDGLFDGLDAQGALILRLASGERRVMHAADVFLLA